uniref:BZIP domain-containing protein n=1 Tax=Strongyloides stercoralis TaxID=6248 RepID=A0A0K0ENG3_STRER
MSFLNKRKYNFVSDNEKSSDSYKKRREANKAAVDKFRNKEKETKDIQNKLLEDKIKTLENQVKQYDVNRQIDINIMKNEFTKQLGELNNSWQLYFDQFASNMIYQQEQTNAQLLQLANTVDNLSRIIQNQNCNHVIGDLYYKKVQSQEDETYKLPYDSIESSPVKSVDFNFSNNMTNDDQNLPEYPLNDESCVPLNATFTTEGEVNYNGPIQIDLILPGRPPPNVIEELEDVTSLDELNYFSKDNDTFSFML